MYLPPNSTIELLCLFTVSSVICYYFDAQNNVFLLPLLLGIIQQYGKLLHLGMDYEVKTNNSRLFYSSGYLALVLMVQDTSITEPEHH